MTAKSTIFLGFLLTITISFLPSLVCQANALDVIPNENFCSPMLDSKHYLTSDFSTYPRTVRFECSYQCKINGSLQTIIATSKIQIHSIDEDATGVVCQGVLVKKVAWGYDFDKVEPFYAYNSNLVEIKRWAFENVSIKNPTEIQFLQKLKADLYTISSSFIMAGINGEEATRHFAEAGKRLSAIADALPNDTTLLDEAIKQIIVNKGVVKFDSTADSLVFMMLSTSASWKIPNYLF